MTDPIRLTPQELIDLTGYVRGSDQLRVLHSRGYARAYRNAAGHVVLERAYYLAICAAGQPKQKPSANIAWQTAA